MINVKKNNSSIYRIGSDLFFETLMNFYVSVRNKFLISLFFAMCWFVASAWLSYFWLLDLSKVIGVPLAIFFIFFLALLPGFINAFIACALLLDRRPQVFLPKNFPDVDVLIPVYNDGKEVIDTIKSVMAQDYPGILHVIVINDGSNVQTRTILNNLSVCYPQIHLINLPRNTGKAYALNEGLKIAKSDVIISIDADCWVKRDAIKLIVSRYLCDPPNTKAIAGSILVRNSRENWLTKAQEWDYFLGIAAIKRIQSLFQGTLVAQGAFSLYDRSTLIKLGGWPITVGEDIVLTWRFLSAGYRIGHAENACVFTNAPNSLKQFIRQRQRWSRGLIEAFKEEPTLLLKPRLSILFIWWNFLFPFIDIAYTLGFIPGLILALFGKFWLVGPMTLALIPPGLLLNQVMFRSEKQIFDNSNLGIRKNFFGLFFYMIAYGILLQPACVWGYFSELFKLKKVWGTK